MKNFKTSGLSQFYVGERIWILLIIGSLLVACDPNESTNTPVYPFTLRLRSFDPAPAEYYVLNTSGLESVTPSLAFETHVNEWLDFLADPATLGQEFLRSVRFISDENVETVWFEPISGDSITLSASYINNEDFLTLLIENEQIELSRNADLTEVRWCEQMFMQTFIIPNSTQVGYRGPQSQPCYELPNFRLIDFVDGSATLGDTIVYIPYELVYKL